MKNSILACVYAIALLGAIPVLLRAQPIKDESYFLAGKSGEFRFGGLDFGIVHFNASWQARYQFYSIILATNHPVVHTDTYEYRGVFSAGQMFDFQERVQLSQKTRFTYTARLRHENGIPTKMTALEVKLPAKYFAGKTIMFDGVQKTLPGTFQNMTDLYRETADTVLIPSFQGNITIQGKGVVLITDNRKFKLDYFSIRFLFTPEAGLIRDTSIVLEFQIAAGNGALQAGDDISVSFASNIISADRRWRPMQHQVSVAAGSVLDLSGLNDAPAGKYGRVIANRGALEFEKRPGSRIRFYGCNICFDCNFQPKENTDALADDLSRMGYNTVRIHHFDRDLALRKTNSTDLNPEAMDKLDYLVFALKQRGLYTAMDLYTLRETLPDEIQGISGTLSLQKYKVTAALHEPTFDNWKRFAEQLLNHINPYTKTAWKNESSIITISALNEDNLYAYWREAERLYQPAFQTWLKERGLPAQACEGKEFNRYLYELQLKLFVKCRDFLKGMDVTPLIADVNMHYFTALSHIRHEMDFAETHGYWDHPVKIIPGKTVPMRYKQGSDILFGAELPQQIMASRLLSKPFALTEYHYCAPNHYRGESIIMSAYGSLQDWNIIQRFAYSHWAKNTQTPKALSHFDIVTDPISLMADRIAVLLFRRADIAPATTKIPLAVSERILERMDIFGEQGMPPPVYARLGFVAHIGQVVTGNSITSREHPYMVHMDTDTSSSGINHTQIMADENLYKNLALHGLIDPRNIDTENNRYVSETGEITLDVNRKYFSVISLKTECFVLFDNRSIRGTVLAVSNHGDFSVFCLSSADGRNISESRRLALYHLTDVQNSGMTYRDATDRVLESWGTMPHLLRRGTADISLLRRPGTTDAVWAVDMSGKRIHKMQTTLHRSMLTFTVDTAAIDAGALVYEIISTPEVK